MTGTGVMIVLKHLMTVVGVLRSVVALVPESHTP